jgi:hypothetical protein
MSAVCPVGVVCYPFDEFAARAHECVDEWLECLRETFEAGQRPTLRQLSVSMQPPGG